MSTPLKEALVDVRRAYRLLADYQQRLLETLEFMRKELGFESYYHSFNCQKVSTPSPYKMAESALGGIHALPLLWCNLFWLKKQGDNPDPSNLPQQGDIMINVWIRSDKQGHSDFYWDDDKAEWGTLETIPTPEDSDSELLFAVYVCDQSTSENTNWFWKVYQENGWPTMYQVAETNKTRGFRVYLDKINLANLDSEDAVGRELTTLRARVSQKLGVEI